MALNSKYFVTSDLESYFVDKDSGEPLAAGVVTFYSQNNPSVKKPVYQITSPGPGLYVYNVLPNPCILSAVGTFQDANGNNIVPYYYPYDSLGNLDLYYITVYNSGGIFQFSRIGWPNSAASTSVSNAQAINYIPNGQFLAHNDGTITPTTITGAPGGSVDYTPIAQGGWYTAKSTGGGNTYTNSFTQETTPINGLNDFPRYVFNYVCTNNASDVVRDLVVRFPGVNNLASNSGTALTYTFFFAAQTNGPNFTFDVRQQYYFGAGSATVSSDSSIGGITVTSSWAYYSITLTFPVQNGAVGTGNDDFVQIALRGPSTGTWSVEFTDFVQIMGDFSTSSIPFFPVVTDAQMLDETLAGWLPIPAPNNASLYLPVLLGPSGLIYDTSVVGNVVAAFSNTAPLGTLLCDGSEYIYANYSNVGIPYSRLADYLIANCPISGIPLFGTGATYNNSYVYAGATTIFSLVNNTAGVGTYAVDGNTGWTFGAASTQTTPGLATINYRSYVATSANTLECVGKWGNVTAAAPGAGTSGFTVSISYDPASPSTYISLTAFQNYSFIISNISAAAALVNTGNPGKYFTFANSTTSFYIWFKFTNETDPAPGGTGIEILVPSSALSAADVTNLIMNTMNGFLINSITVSAVPTASKYFVFTTNPSAAKLYYAWYQVDGVGTDPAPGGRTGVKVVINSTDTTAQVASKTQVAINKYQYQVPDLRGMFLRGLDPSATYDIDVLYRSSTVAGLFGAYVGTMELQQILGHVHGITITGDGVTPATVGSGGGVSRTGTVTGIAGGNETRSVNTSVNWFIKY